jgi:hypothetical protein
LRTVCGLAGSRRHVSPSPNGRCRSAKAPGSAPRYRWGTEAMVHGAGPQRGQSRRRTRGTPEVGTTTALSIFLAIDALAAKS